MTEGSTPSAGDYGWLLFIAVVSAGLLASFGRMLYLVATKQQLRALVPLPVGLACAVLLVAIAWRRTVWWRRRREGAPAPDGEAAQ